ncbi:hypothetical protein Tsubulata_027071, partial [Turnera subulata]
TIALALEWRNLEVLDLNIIRLRTLKTLNLDFTGIDGSNLLKSVGGLPSLKTLSFKCTSQTVDQVPQGIQAIDFSKNHFEGSIPGEICNLDQLEFLDLSENNLSGSIPSCTNLPRISHVHLYQNQFSGPLTYAFFNSTNLVTLDLRENQLTGTVPNWISSLSKLSVLLLKVSGKLSLDSGEDSSLLSVGRKKLAQQGIFLIEKTLWPVISVEEVIEFTTKKSYYTYKDSILNYMSGVDLSCNRFTGEIPQEFGNMKGLRALNLSHNNLTGAIPSTFSNLEQIESLDLSDNGLSGGIPQQLTELYSLSVFRVAYNNLSGKTPEMKGQFGTFDQTSNEGNPLLCGPPLRNNCMEKSQLASGLDDSSDNQESDGLMDMGAFCICFGLSYTTVVVTIATVLCINPYWRRLWFYFIEMFVSTCYYFVVNSFHKLCPFFYGFGN